MKITFGRAFHVSFHYHLLRQLNLGLDAASLWQKDTLAPAWAGPLTALYQAADAEERLRLQGLPLESVELDQHMTLLLRQPAELFAVFADLMLVEEPRFLAQWLADSAATQRLQDAQAKIEASLHKLRAALWARRDATPPPLTIWDATSLGPHGRAMAFPKRRCCAVSLAQPLDHALCQIFHEETHAIADLETHEGMGESVVPGSRDTRQSSDGYAYHERIEQHAIRVGAEVISAVAPSWVQAYERWCAPFGGVS